jgi:predicted SnoaL-like aldol condensation-catalyzing enzyme
MANNENLKRLTSHYEISKDDIQRLQNSIGPNTDINVALQTGRFAGDSKTRSLEEIVANDNYEYSGNGNSNSFIAMHNFFESGTISSPKSHIYYEIIDGKMVFDQEKPRVPMPNGKATIQYFTDLAKYQPKFFQTFLISGIARNAADVNTVTTLLTKKIQEPKSDLFSIEEAFNLNIANFTRDYSLSAMGAIGKQELVNYIIANNPDILNNNPELAETVKIFNKVSNETISIFKEKIEIVNTEFFNGKIDLDILNNYSAYNLPNETPGEKFKDVAVQIFTGISIDKTYNNNDDSKKSFLELKNKLCLEQLQIISSEFKEILNTPYKKDREEDQKILKARMLE